MEIIHGYRDNEMLRKSFNALAEEIFGLNFEDWYQRGFWTDCYNPYSVVIGGEVVANVSVNRTDMVVDGELLRLIQLGTVMTKPEYRNRGLIRGLMERIAEDYRDADGVYLFANDTVREFYPKFGFREGMEFGYSKNVAHSGAGDMTCVPMDSRENWDRLAEAMGLGEPLSACAMANNPGLIFFYVTGFMPGSVWYSPSLGAWAVAELEEGNLLLHNVFAPKGVSMDEVIRAFGEGVSRVELGFAPVDPSGWAMMPVKEEDSTFFVKGAAFDRWEKQGMRIPTLSHA